LQALIQRTYVTPHLGEIADVVVGFEFAALVPDETGRILRCISAGIVRQGDSVEVVEIEVLGGRNVREVGLWGTGRSIGR
jgi:hypothetical protein